MPNVVLFPTRSTNIPGLAAVVDGYPDTVHQLETDTGKSPLAVGAEKTDHAVAREEVLVFIGLDR